MKKILVIVDCQNDFIDGALRNEEAIKKVDNIINKLYENDYHMIYVTKDTHGPHYLSTPEGQKLPIEHCIRGTHGWELNEKLLKVLDNEFNFYKTIEKDTFGSVNLPIEIIKHIAYVNDTQKDYSIEFVGFCTDICVVSNALTCLPWLKDCEIIVDASCCAGTTIEKHNAALDVMESCQIKIINR